MITLEEKISRTRRLLRRLEEDEPHFHLRLSPLGAEHRQSATAFADRIDGGGRVTIGRLNVAGRGAAIVGQRIGVLG